VSLELRWTEQAVNQLGAIAEYIGLASPIYAEQIVDRVVGRLRQAQDFPASGRHVPEGGQTDLRELIEAPYRVIYRVVPGAILVIAIVHGRQDLGTRLPS
jgi:plasmid stabilization system protein ParE